MCANGINNPFKSEPENCHLFQKRFRSSFISLKTKSNKQNKREDFWLFFYYKRKKKLWQIIILTQSLFKTKLICPWNLPILNLNIKFSIINKVQACISTIDKQWSANMSCRRKWDNFFTGFSSKSWPQVYLPKWKQKNHKWKQQSLFGSGSAWEELYIGIIAINYFDF